MIYFCIYSQILSQGADGKGWSIFVSNIKNFILIVIGAQSLTQAKEIFLSFQKRSSYIVT
jgi:hypothetical protein